MHKLAQSTQPDAIDIPAALKLFAIAEDGFRRAAPQWLPVLATDKARALLAVGLSSDAIDELNGTIAAFRRQRLDQDLAQAEMTLAQAALRILADPALKRRLERNAYAYGRETAWPRVGERMLAVLRSAAATANPTEVRFLAGVRA